MQSQTRSPFPRYDESLAKSATACLLQSQTRSPFPRYWPPCPSPENVGFGCNLKREARSLATMRRRRSACLLFLVAISNEKPVPSLRSAQPGAPPGAQCCNLKREARSLATANQAYYYQVEAVLQSQTRSPFPRYETEHCDHRSGCTVAISNEKPVPSLQPRACAARLPYRRCNLKREARSLATQRKRRCWHE